MADVRNPLPAVRLEGLQQLVSDALVIHEEITNVRRKLSRPQHHPLRPLLFWRKKIGEDEEVRRATQAVHRSSIIIARAVFEAAIRDHADLCELIEPEPVPSTQRSVEDDS